MDSVHEATLNEGVHAERQQLLSPPIAHRDTGHEQNPTMSFTKLGASALNFFLSGISMVAVGAMIPEFERYYTINDTRAALVFPAGVLGYILATVTTPFIQSHKGRRGIAVIAPVCRLLFAVILSNQPLFSVFLVSFAGLGYGTGLTDTAWNAWASGTPRPNVVSGFLHGSFSLGCVAGPVVVTFALRTGNTWCAFYITLCCLLCVELIVQSWAFRHDAGGDAQLEPTIHRNGSVQNAFRRPSLWICGIFYMVYQGVEASFTDWIVVFLIRTRHIDAATATSASSVFWLGMALGRYALGAVSERVGMRMAVSGYIVAAMGAQVSLIFLSKLSGMLVTLAVCGFFLAPLFPSGIVVLASQTEPRDLIRIVAGAIAMGQAGGAIVPFGLGLLSTHVGIEYLLHVTLALTLVLFMLWTTISGICGETTSG